jgi:hypothetical protein
MMGLVVVSPPALLRLLILAILVVFLPSLVMAKQVTLCPQAQTTVTRATPRPLSSFANIVVCVSGFFFPPFLS